MVTFDSVEIVMVIAAVVAGLAAIILVWCKTKGGWGKLAVEALFEIGLTLLLGINIAQFSEDTEIFFRRRLKVSIIMLYFSAVVSTLGFIASTMVAAARGIDSNFSKQFGKNASRLAWVLHIFISLAAFVAYLTVSEETDALDGGAGEDQILYLIGFPATISILIVGWHMIACCYQRTCRWRITEYSPVFMKAMVTFFAVFLMASPFIKGDDGGDESNDDVNFAEAVAMGSELLGAFMHRVSLQDDDDDNGDDVEQDGGCPQHEEMAF